MIHRINPFVTQFRSAAKLLKQPNVTHIEIRIRDDLPGIDTRTCNRPSSNEVAVIIPEYDQKKDNRKIVLTKNDGSLKQVNPLNPAFDPLLYVLMFPHGDPGYHPEIALKKSKNIKMVTPLQFYRYRLMVIKMF